MLQKQVAREGDNSEKANTEERRVSVKSLHSLMVQQAGNAKKDKQNPWAVISFWAALCLQSQVPLFSSSWLSCD